MDYRAWNEALGLDEAYSFAVVIDTTPDQALQRLGAQPDQIASGSWDDLQNRVQAETPDLMDHLVLAAFDLGQHTLIVEGISSFVNAPFTGMPPEISASTTAIASSFDVESMNNFQVLVDGVEVANYGENGDLDAVPPLVQEALDAMGVEADDVVNTVADRGRDLELISRITGVHPQASDVTGIGRIAVVPLAD